MTKSAEEETREDVLNSVFVLQFFAKEEAQSENDIDVLVTTVNKNSVENNKIDIHELIDNEASFWTCVNTQKAQGKGYGEAVMICLNRRQ